MRPKRYDPTPNHVLVDENDAATIPQDVLEGLTENGVEWLEAGTDDLRVGDVIRVRQCLPVVAGRGSHGQPVFEKTAGYNHRQVKVRREYLAVGEVQRVYRKATRTPGKTVLMVQYGLVWDCDHDKLSRVSNGFAQKTVIEGNAKPIGKRQLEVRRLRGSGPTREERAEIDAETHSRLARAGMFANLWETVPTSAIVLSGNPYIDEDKRTVVTMTDIEAWLDGSVEPPAWAMNVLIKQREKHDDGDLPAGLAAAVDATPTEVPPAAKVETPQEPVVEAHPAPVADVEDAPAIDEDVQDPLRDDDIQAPPEGDEFGIPATVSLPDEYPVNPDEDDSEDSDDDMEKAA
ncbi:hypothetical protein [Aurantimonas coralicida]|uniref:hypothetical protein n=1 Tax=Aurantimonas coralicida TaxID=182270 RepID=UPI000420EE17|nr:hypothetical protein [Aurantimonas coralicida]